MNKTTKDKKIVLTDETQNVKQDRRIKYTKMMLKQSLLELMKQKPIDRITTSELCRAADINRNTFYSHYSVVRDVLEEIETELSAELMNTLDFNGSIKEILTKICKMMYEKRDLCTILVSRNGDINFMQTMFAQIKKQTTEDWMKNITVLSDAESSMLFDFFFFGAIAIIRVWSEKGMKLSPEEVATFLEKVTKKGESAFLEK